MDNQTETVALFGHFLAKRYIRTFFRFCIHIFRPFVIESKNQKIPIYQKINYKIPTKNSKIKKTICQKLVQIFISFCCVFSVYFTLFCWFFLPLFTILIHRTFCHRNKHMRAFTDKVPQASTARTVVHSSKVCTSKIPSKQQSLINVQGNCVKY